MITEIVLNATILGDLIDLENIEADCEPPLACSFTSQSFP